MSSSNIEPYNTEEAAPNNHGNKFKFDDDEYVSNEQDGLVVIPQYHEQEVDTLDYVKHITANPLQKAKAYVISLFPIVRWLPHYNHIWLTGDLISGITVGVVLVPQSMSYATLAGLSPEYGLYSSFIGVLIYCFFATSKDVSIGPVAVMSAQVGRIITKVQGKNPDYSAPVIATILTLICGGISFGLGIFRLGFLLELISLPAVLAFMSGSAFNILTGQVPALMGYNKLVNTRDPTYKVVINTLKHLPDSDIDAAFGLVGLFILYAWKFTCTKLGAKYPKRAQTFFFLNNIRHAVVIVFSTLISWGAVYNLRKTHNNWKLKPAFSIIGKVPSGLKHTGVMKIPDGIVSDLASELPVSTIILLLEHISIAKSFGRINDYKINPNQELIAIGVTNLIGTFFNAYPATGSFSRSALKAKSGVRTPLAGIFTGACVLLALYCFTKAFYFIPKATLSAIIIHAVSDLIASYKTSFFLYKISPLDFGIFIIGVIITVFGTIEEGIYFSIAASAAHLLWNLCIPNGTFLGTVQVAEVVNPAIDGSSDPNSEYESSSSNVSYEEVDVENDSLPTKKQQTVKHIHEKNGKNIALQRKLPQGIKFHTRWVPFPKEASPFSSPTVHTSRINDGIKVSPPPPGVIVFRPSESFIYPNSSRQVDTVLDEVKRLTKRSAVVKYASRLHRPWNDPGELSIKQNFESFLAIFSKSKAREVQEYASNEVAAVEEDPRPTLQIIHFDFSQVISIDATAVQNLVDLRTSVNSYAGREVEFHFSHIINPWVKKGLIAAGFGKSVDTSVDGAIVATHRYFDIGTSDESAAILDEEQGDSQIVNYYSVLGTDTPFFHLDIPSYNHLDPNN